jgi:hypothetical protein
MTSAFAAEVVAREMAQLIVNQRHQALRSISIALAPNRRALW